MFKSCSIGVGEDKRFATRKIVKACPLVKTASLGWGQKVFCDTDVCSKYVLGQNYFLGVGPEIDFVTPIIFKACPRSRPLPWGWGQQIILRHRKCSKHVLGQNRFLGAGLENYFVTHNFSKHGRTLRCREERLIRQHRDAEFLQHIHEHGRAF